MAKKSSVEVSRESGYTYWMDESNRLHRDDGPAVEWADGFKYWYQEGELHREDGPAVERPSGNNSWYVRDRRVTEEEFVAYQKEQRMKKALGLV